MTRRDQLRAEARLGGRERLDHHWEGERIPRVGEEVVLEGGLGEVRGVVDTQHGRKLTIIVSEVRP